jgi:hypothetical protein
LDVSVVSLGRTIKRMTAGKAIGQIEKDSRPTAPPPESSHCRDIPDLGVEPPRQRPRRRPVRSPTSTKPSAMGRSRSSGPAGVLIVVRPTVRGPPGKCHLRHRMRRRARLAPSPGRTGQARRYRRARSGPPHPDVHAAIVRTFDETVPECSQLSSPRPQERPPGRQKGKADARIRSGQHGISSVMHPVAGHQCDSAPATTGSRGPSVCRAKSVILCERTGTDESLRHGVRMLTPGAGRRSWCCRSPSGSAPTPHSSPP